MINMLNVSSLCNLKNLWMCMTVCASTFTCIWYLYLMFEVNDVCKLKEINDIHCRKKVSIHVGRFCVLESNIEYCWPFRCSVCVKFWYIDMLKHKSGFSCITACLGPYLENLVTKGLHVWFIGCHEYMYVWKSLFLLK